MKQNSIIHIVGVQFKPELEKKFQKWYEEVHVPILFKFPGLKKITEYKIVSSDVSFPNFLAIYEFDNIETFEKYEKSEELAISRKQAKETWGEEEQKIKWRVQYKTIKIWEK